MNKEHYIRYTELTDTIKTKMLQCENKQCASKIAEFIKMKNEKYSYSIQDDKYYINSFFPSLGSKAWNRMVDGFYKIAVENKRIPIQADIVITGRCHCKCWHCFRIKDCREDLSFGDIIKCMKDLKDLGVATLGITGGEPMLRDDIVDIIKAIPDCVEGQLYTTGHNITQPFLDDIKHSNLTRFIISLDHYDEEIVCNLRNNKNAFKEAVSAIKLLTQNGLYTAVTVCVTDELLIEGAFQKYFDFVKSLNPNEIRVILPIPQGNLEGTNVGRLYSDALKFIKKFKFKYDNDSASPSIVNFCEFESAHYMGCAAGANYITINNDGLVTPCVAVSLAFGNIKNESLAKIFNDMGTFFPKSGRICYGKTSGRIINRMNLDTSITPLPIDVSKNVASKCHVSSERASFFQYLKSVEVKNEN